MDLRSCRFCSEAVSSKHTVGLFTNQADLPTSHQDLGFFYTEVPVSSSDGLSKYCCRQCRDSFLNLERKLTQETGWVQFTSVQALWHKHNQCQQLILQVLREPRTLLVCLQPLQNLDHHAKELLSAACSFHKVYISYNKINIYERFIITETSENVDPASVVVPESSAVPGKHNHHACLSLNVTLTHVIIRYTISTTPSTICEGKWKKKY